MKQGINIDIKGHLKITEEQSGNILYDDHNALSPNYRNIIRRCIAGELDKSINQLQAWYQGNLISTTTLISKSYSVITNNEVTFFFKFLDTDFNSNFDKVVLGSNVGGDFSEVLDLSLSKDNNTTLQIQWTLKIINQ
jgi:hypothetical protein